MSNSNPKKTYACFIGGPREGEVQALKYAGQEIKMTGQPRIGPDGDIEDPREITYHRLASKLSGEIEWVIYTHEEEELSYSDILFRLFEKAFMEEEPSSA